MNSRKRIRGWHLVFFILTLSIAKAPFAATLTIDSDYTATSDLVAPDGLDITSTGILSLDGFDLNLSGSFSSEGGTLNAGSGDIFISGDWQNSGTFNADSGTVILNGTGIQGIQQGTYSGFNSFNNLIMAGSGTASLTSNLLVNGTLTQQSGIFNTNAIYADIANLDITGGTFESSGGGGFWTVGNLDVSGSGTMSAWDSSGIITGNVHLSGGTLEITSTNLSVAGDWQNTGATVNTLASNVTLDGSGTQTVTTGGQAFYDLTLNNTGTVALADDLAVNNTLQQNSGNLQTNGQSITAGSLNVTGGTFNSAHEGGAWLINSDASLAGTGVINVTTDTMTVGGNWTQSGGLLNFDITGLGTGEYSILDISGLASFTDGNIVFNFDNGFMASAGDSWDFIFANAFDGWDNLSISVFGLMPGLDYEFINSDNHYSLSLVEASAQSVPEPPALLLLLLGLSALLWKSANNVNGCSKT